MKKLYSLFFLLVGAPFSSQGDLFTLDIATAALSDGLHTLGVRAYNGHHWGQTFTKLFLKPSSSLIPNIDRVEYYWDEDPGYGQGIQIAFTVDSIVEIDRYEVDTKELNEGKHILHIRASAGGVWIDKGHYSKQGLSIQRINWFLLVNMSIQKHSAFGLFYRDNPPVSQNDAYR